jgi:hypothetical protein
MQILNPSMANPEISKSRFENAPEASKWTYAPDAVPVLRIALWSSKLSWLNLPVYFQNVSV